MAKMNHSVTFEKATINMEDLTLTEFLKDEAIEHGLIDIFKDWAGIDNLTISIKNTGEYTADVTED